jgi:hypothetical protein
VARIGKIEFVIAFLKITGQGFEDFISSVRVFPKIKCPVMLNGVKHLGYFPLHCVSLKMTILDNFLFGIL